MDKPEVMSLLSVMFRTTSAVTTNLDNALIDNSPPTAFKVSPFTTASSTLFVGTATVKFCVWTMPMQVQLGMRSLVLDL